MLTLSKSKRIINAAIQRARQLDTKISIAVCGRDGRLIAFSRMDGCVGWGVDVFSGNGNRRSNHRMPERSVVRLVRRWNAAIVACECRSPSGTTRRPSHRGRRCR
jgi:hypothetical protein